jgi:RNA polymerase sigma factor (sigma-70 family)
VDGDSATFDNYKRKLMMKLLAAVMDIDEDAVRILRVEEGSTKVTIEVPSESAERLDLLQALGPEDDFELFRRAIEEADQESWETIFAKYRDHVLRWVDVDFDADDLVQATFLKFWQMLYDKNIFDRFESLGQVISYLKFCAKSVSLVAYRQASGKLDEKAVSVEIAEQSLEDREPEHIIEISDLVSQVFSLLKDEKERIVVELTFAHGMTPRQIQAAQPDLFPDTLTVYRIKERVLARLRRQLDFPLKQEMDW